MEQGLFLEEGSLFLFWGRIRWRKRKPPACKQVVEFQLERTTGVEPATTAWEAGMLPLHHIRIYYIIYFCTAFCNDFFLAASVENSLQRFAFFAFL